MAFESSNANVSGNSEKTVGIVVIAVSAKYTLILSCILDIHYNPDGQSRDIALGQSNLISFSFELCCTAARFSPELVWSEYGLTLNYFPQGKLDPRGFIHDSQCRVTKISIKESSPFFATPVWSPAR